MRRLEPGKLPAGILARLLGKYRVSHDRLIVGPGVGEDAAAIDMGGRVLVAKTDPITFATDRIGWYAVNVNANDIVTMGARPMWFLATVLLPEKTSDAAMADSIFEDIASACRALGIVCCGGHIEVTVGLDRVLIAGQMLGEVPREKLLSKANIQPGMAILLAKPMGIEATSLLAREFPRRVADAFGAEFAARAQEFLFDPGISIVQAALAAADTGCVVAMHDPTEGGVATGLHELAEAGGVGVEADTGAIPIRDETARLCEMFGMNPLGVISSGALLIVAPDGGFETVTQAVNGTGAECVRIGCTTEHLGRIVNQHGDTLPRFDTDEISKAFA